MSVSTNFHTTENLLLERKKLHELVDYFWQKMPYTRDAIYARISDLLGVPHAHISDMTTEQIKAVATSFQESLEEVAPCSSCLYRLSTTYGITYCQHQKMKGAYWLGMPNGPERCKAYVPVNIPKQGCRKSGSGKTD